MELTGVSQTQCPQSQVGSRMWHTAQTELNGVNGLVDYHLAQFELKQNKIQVRINP